MAKHTVTNTSNGPRGFYAETGLVMLEAGEVREDVEVSDAEVKSAKAVGLEFGQRAAKAAEKAADKD